ncbi:MAG: sodium:alanine symporter family protein, partial [Deltaproteobacteria bacterium]|nr:sodium:alanine symporter family protein [Deltaproteobacteria bacterium]
MDIFSRFLTAAVDVAWGVPLVVLLIGGGLYLCLVSRLLPLRGFWHAIKLTLGIDKVPGDLTAEGQISHFKALTNALAATIGMGNIAGVAVAIQQGGPGAIFWMWVAAFIGMVTKYFECTIAIKYRGKNYK